MKFGSRTIAPPVKTNPNPNPNPKRGNFPRGQLSGYREFSSFKMNTCRDLFSRIFRNENTLVIGTKRSIKVQRRKLNEKSKTC